MPNNSPDLARQLLDAQVAFHVDQLSGDQLADTLTALADDLFDAAGERQLADLIDTDAVKQIVTGSLTEVPSSSAVGGIVDMAVSVLSEGPDQPAKLGEMVERGQVVALMDAIFALTPVLERALDRLTASPMVGTVASRFMGRIAGEVLAANQAIADKIPGLGSLTRLGTSAASKVVGAADKQIEGLMAATVGKGSTFDVRRLNRILIETIDDPATREALLQVWDLVAEEPLTGLKEHLTEEQIADVSEAGYDLAVTALKHNAVAGLASALVDGFMEWFGGYTPVELLEHLNLDRDDLVADLRRLAPQILGAARESGHLERIVRARLEPFYASPAVADILSADPA